MCKIIVYLVALFAMATCLVGQDIRTATLVGTVTDNSGAVIANVSVVVTNVDTQVVTRSVTNGEGAYYVPFLNVGNYRLTMEAPGFKKIRAIGPGLECGRKPSCGRDTGGGIGNRRDIKVTARRRCSTPIRRWSAASPMLRTFTILRSRNPSRSTSCITRRARRRTTTALTTSWASPSRR